MKLFSSLFVYVSLSLLSGFFTQNKYHFTEFSGLTYALIMKTPSQLTIDFRTPNFTSVCELILCFVKLF